MSSEVRDALNFDRDDGLKEQKKKHSYLSSIKNRLKRSNRSMILS